MTSVYTLAAEPSVCKDRKTHKWTYEDISSILLVDLFKRFRSIEVSINDIYGAPKTLNLNLYESPLRDKKITISEWLVENGNSSLILSDGYPTLEFKSVSYVPMAYNMPKIELAKNGYHPSHDVVLDDMDDLIVNYDGVDPARLSDYGLWSVAGFFLPTTYHSYGLRIRWGGDVVRRSQDVSAGFLNFEGIGKVRKIPIQSHMVHKVTETLSYYDSVLIDVGVPLFNKTVGIVIGGYLHLLDSVIKVIGESTIKLTMRDIDTTKRVLESRHALDLAFMGFEDIETSVTTSQIRDDKKLLEYLTSKYSFVVVIDNPEITLETTSPDRAASLGRFIIPKGDNLGLLTNKLGRNLEYWPTFEGHDTVLHTQDCYDKTMAITTTNWHNMIRFNDAGIGYRPVTPVEPTMKNFVSRIKK